MNVGAGLKDPIPPKAGGAAVGPAKAEGTAVRKELKGDEPWKKDILFILGKKIYQFLHFLGKEEIKFL